MDIDDALETLQHDNDRLTTELAEARAEVADLLPRMDADAMTISNLVRDLAAERREVARLHESLAKQQELAITKRAARQEAKAEVMALREALTAAKWLLGTAGLNLSKQEQQQWEQRWRVFREALDNPSPAAERIAAVLEAAQEWDAAWQPGGNDLQRTLRQRAANIALRKAVKALVVFNNPPTPPETA